jgi:FkbM family methyltransferase
MSSPRQHALGLVLTALLIACGSENHPAKPDDSPTATPTDVSTFADLTPEQVEAYGNRAEFFNSWPEPVRADLDWRSALSPALVDAEPKWSQALEELVIRDFFADREGGFFVDVGCYLPRNGSTTYYLENQLNWAGIGIDVLEKYAKAWARQRPKSTFVHAAVTDTDGETLELYVAGYIATLEKNVIDAWGLEESATTIEVETSTLNTILEQRGIEKIDFLSIDIEGAELAALRGFDIKRFRPELCGIEANNNYDALAEYFEANGYELIQKYRKVDKINLYYRPKPTE